MPESQLGLYQQQIGFFPGGRRCHAAKPGIGGLLYRIHPGAESLGPGLKTLLQFANLESLK